MADAELFPVELSDPAYECEGLRHATANSRALGRRGDATFWSTPVGATAEPVPLVILLHGVYGSHWAWAHKAGAHRTAAALDRPIALAMPSDGLFGLGSGYVPHRGGDFASWILDEVPRLAAMALPYELARAEDSQGPYMVPPVVVTAPAVLPSLTVPGVEDARREICLLYTSDAADE